MSKKEASNLPQEFSPGWEDELNSAFDAKDARIIELVRQLAEAQAEIAGIRPVVPEVTEG